MMPCIGGLLSSEEVGSHPSWGHVPGSSPPLQDSADDAPCHTHRAAIIQTYPLAGGQCLDVPQSQRLSSKGRLAESVYRIAGSECCPVPSVGTSRWHLHWHTSSSRLLGFSRAGRTCPSLPHPTLGSQDLAGAHHWCIWLQSSRVKSNSKVQPVPPPSCRLCWVLGQLSGVPRPGSHVPTGGPWPHLMVSMPCGCSEGP